MKAKNMQEKFIDEPFIYRGYSKPELSQMYNPHMTLKSAVEVFNKWLRHDPRFWIRLQKTGVNIRTQYYRRSQVEMIVDHLGEP